MRKNNKGITLIALIITIIVLLILAGVALATLTGDSGILSNSDKAKEQTNLANSKEQVELAIQGALTEGVGKVTYGKLVGELDKLIGAGNYTITPNDEVGPWTVTVTKTDYTTIVYTNGKIEASTGSENAKEITFKLTMFTEEFTLTAYEGEDWYTWVSRITLDGLRDLGFTADDIDFFDHLIENPTDYLAVAWGMAGSYYIRSTDGVEQIGSHVIVDGMSYNVEE